MIQHHKAMCSAPQEAESSFKRRNRHVAVAAIDVGLKWIPIPEPEGVKCGHLSFVQEAP
jgi:hypothetical protein